MWYGLELSESTDTVRGMVNISRSVKRELVRTNGTIKATPLSPSISEGRLRMIAYIRLLSATITPDCACEQCADRRNNISEMLGWLSN